MGVELANATFGAGVGEIFVGVSSFMQIELRVEGDC